MTVAVLFLLAVPLGAGIVTIWLPSRVAGVVTAAAGIASFAARALARLSLVGASLAEPVDAGNEAAQRDFRSRLAGELARRIKTAVDGGHLPDQEEGSLDVVLGQDP